MILRDAIITTALASATLANAEPPGTGEWLRIALYIGGAIFLALGIVEKFRAIFRRTPSVDQDLQNIANAVAKLKETVAGIGSSVPSHVDALKSEIYGNLGERHGEMYDRINDHGERITRTETHVETHERTLAHHAEQIGNLRESCTRKRT